MVQQIYLHFFVDVFDLFLKPGFEAPFSNNLFNLYLVMWLKQQLKNLIVNYLDIEKRLLSLTFSNHFKRKWVSFEMKKRNSGWERFRWDFFWKKLFWNLCCPVKFSRVPEFTITKVAVCNITETKLIRSYS